MARGRRLLKKFLGIGGDVDFLFGLASKFGFGIPVVGVLTFFWWVKAVIWGMPIWLSLFLGAAFLCLLLAIISDVKDILRSGPKPTNDARFRALYNDVSNFNARLSMDRDQKINFRSEDIPQIRRAEIISLYSSLNDVGVRTPKVGDYEREFHDNWHSKFLRDLEVFAKKGQVKLANKTLKPLVR